MYYPRRRVIRSYIKSKVVSGLKTAHNSNQRSKESTSTSPGNPIRDRVKMVVCNMSTADRKVFIIDKVKRMPGDITNTIPKLKIEFAGEVSLNNIEYNSEER